MIAPSETVRVVLYQLQKSSTLGGDTVRTLLHGMHSAPAPAGVILWSEGGKREASAEGDESEDVLRAHEHARIDNEAFRIAGGAKRRGRRVEFIL